MYIPKRTKMKEPEMPGKIMAQMANMPAANTKNKEVDASTGAEPVIK